MKYILYLVLIIFVMQTGLMAQDAYMSRDPFEEPSLTDSELVELMAGDERSVLLKRWLGIELLQNRVQVLGIVWDASAPYCIMTINGIKQILKEDDKIGNRKVIKISRDSVLLKTDTKTFILKVGKEIIL